MDFWDFLIMFLQISFYPIGAFLICGLIVAFCERMVMYFCGRGGRGIIYATSIIGTPVHELGHAFMCVIFGHKIQEVCLWCPNSGDGTLGYVEHSYNRRNIYQRLGNMFIGMVSIFSGLLFTFLVMLICFTETFDAHVISVFTDGYEISSFSDFFSGGFAIIGDMLRDPTRIVIVKIIGFILIMCTCLHINLSPADIKGSLSSLPVYLVITLLLTVAVYFISGEFEFAVMGALSSWLSICITLYLPVIVAALCILLIAFVFYIIRSLVRR